MRRGLIALLLSVLLMLLGSQAAFAETAMTLDSISATVTIPDEYTLITPDNIDANAAWLSARGLNADDLKLEFAASGVLLRGYDEANGRVLEITALKDVDANQIFDVDQQTVAWRATYRKAHLDGDAWGLLGYDYDSAEWKKTNQNGRFLMLKYKLRQDGEVVRRGYQRRTIRNGYTITVDIQVTGRQVTGKDDAAMNKIMNTFVFTQTLPIPPMPVKLTFTAAPPAETNTASFKVTGVTNAKANVTALVLNVGTSETATYTDAAGSTGKFTLNVKLTGEGVYTMIILSEEGDEIPTEQTFDIEYRKTLLPVNFTSPIPDTLSGDKLTIAGTCMPGVTVQLIVNNVAVTKKTGTGKAFQFSADTSAEGQYDIVLLFTKQGLTERRFTATLTREYSTAERYEKTVENAVKPAYSTLTSKLSGYMGRTMVYTGYVTEVVAAGDEWLIFTALTKKTSGYSNIIVVSAKEKPAYAVGETYRMYGRLEGTHIVYDGNGVKQNEYPYFTSLYIENAD